MCSGSPTFAILSDDGDVKRDVDCRIGKAPAVFQKMCQIWPTSSINIATKIWLYNTIVVSVAIYASEAWKTTAREAQKLNDFHQRCLQKNLGVLLQ
jgi:hypothetical protein